MTSEERAALEVERKKALEVLIGELTKLGAKVTKDYCYTVVNDEKVSVEPFEKGGKWRYAISQIPTDKKCSNAKDAAYWIITELIPARQVRRELDKVLDTINEVFPGVALVTMEGEIRIRGISNASAFRQAVTDWAKALSESKE